MQTVRTQRELKQRIDVFFNTEIAKRAEVSEVLSSLTRKANTYVFGGMLRDIGLFGHQGFKSDIDLVFNGCKDTLVRALQEANISHYSENKFGGFRIKGLQWELDIWCAEDTWAIKQGHVEFTGIASLLQTTLMTWDSALYCINDNELILKDNYLEDLTSRKLDVILEKNPNEVGSIVRILRTIYEKQACSLGPKAATLLASSLRSYTSDMLVNYERKSFSTNFISDNNIYNLIDELDEYNGDGDFVLTSNTQANMVCNV